MGVKNAACLSGGRVGSPPRGCGGADLDLLDAVDNEHVLQVLHGSLHPVVEGRGSLGKLQVQLVDCFQQLLSSLRVEQKQVPSQMKYAF